MRGRAGIGLLLPFTVTLSVLQFAVWWPLASRIRAPLVPNPQQP